MATSDDDEAVGYKRPPRHSRFQKGRSGNPRGRPKGSGVRSAVEKLLSQTVMATVDGRRRKVPLTEALVLQLAQRALAGDIAASREILKIAHQAPEEVPAETNAREKLTVLIRRFIDPRDCNPALEKLGAISGVDGGYKIEPWLVEAALARNPSLTSEDRILIGNSTRRSGERTSEQTVEDNGRMSRSHAAHEG